MKMSVPYFKVVRFAADDVIATSLYIMEDAGSSTGYIAFEGSMYGYDSSAQGWIVGQGYRYEISQDEIDQIKNNPTAYPAYFTYDAYQIENYGGGYFTKGASYYELYRDQ